MRKKRSPNQSRLQTATSESGEDDGADRHFLCADTRVCTTTLRWNDKKKKKKEKKSKGAFKVENKQVSESRAGDKQPVKKVPTRARSPQGEPSKDQAPTDITFNKPAQSSRVESRGRDL